jgi:FxLD family lantipeptide
MPSPASLAAAPATGLADDEFELDLKIIESLTPLADMTCDTSDTCGSTCDTTACNSQSSDPS